jgi:hypothetical protein
MNSWIMGRAPRIHAAISLVDEFGMRNQMTFGGLPHKTLRSWKSESFETIVKPSRRAYSQMASSSALPSPQECTWIDPENSLCSTSARRGGRFSSSSSFTLFAILVCVRGPRRRPGKHGYPHLSDREIRAGYPHGSSRSPGFPAHHRP